MTEFVLPSTIIGAIAVAVVAFLSVTLLLPIVETETRLVTPAKNIEVINAIHLAKSCLGTGEGIPEAILESNRDRGICEICRKELAGLCMGKTGLGMKIRDLEGPREWGFGYTGSKKHKAEIFVNIVNETGKITLGRLYAEV